MVCYEKYITHTVVGTQERWQDLAIKYYGDCFNFAPLVMNNPDIPIGPFLPQGVKIIVPILKNSDTENLPPWKK